MRSAPTWLVYLFALLAVLWVLSRVDEPAETPNASPDVVREGPMLPGPSAYTPEVLVDVGPIASGWGTAFAIDAAGWWLTARHVVDACDKVGVVVARGRAMAAQEVRVARFADLALIKTPGAPDPLQLETLDENLRLGQTAFHVGYPQGRPGEAASRLIGRETLIARGRFELDEPVLAWAELGRTRGLTGSLAGLSGGPVFDAKGRVIGVTIAESSRRGRIYTATPRTIAHMLGLNQLAPTGRPAGRLSLGDYWMEADRLRRNLTVAQVVCVAN